VAQIDRGSIFVDRHHLILACSSTGFNQSSLFHWQTPNPNNSTEISTHPRHRCKWSEVLPPKIQMFLVSIQGTREDVASLWEFAGTDRPKYGT